MTAEIGAHGAVAGGVALALGVEHVEELAPPAEQGLQLLGGGIREGARGGLHAGPEEREDLGIEGIGLREAAGVALAKSRTCRGLTMTTGRAALARAATTGASYPPVASRTISVTGWAWHACTSAARPAASVAKLPVHPAGSLASTTASLATSIPRYIRPPR